jgi:hypothetical protein
MTKLLHSLDSEQIARETGIEKVEFGRLGQAFAEVGMQWRQTKHEIARLKHVHPRTSGRVGDADFGPNLRQVEELPGSSSQNPDESLESAQVRDIENTPNVSFGIGSDIARVEDVKYNTIPHRVASLTNATEVGRDVGYLVIFDPNSEELLG